MKVLLVSEGRHELGDSGIRGALHTLVLRLLETHHECTLKKVSDRELRVHGGRGEGFFKKAVRCLLFAEKSEFDAVVLVIDEDGEPHPRRQIRDAQEYDRALFPRAFGVAIRTFDAWMLADQTALTKVLGYSVNRQPDPEILTDPKSTAKQLRDSSPNAPSLTQMYSTVAEQIDLAQLASRCPDGFGTFADRVRKLSQSSAD